MKRDNCPKSCVVGCFVEREEYHKGTGESPRPTGSLITVSFHWHQSRTWRVGSGHRPEAGSLALSSSSPQCLSLLFSPLSSPVLYLLFNENLTNLILHIGSCGFRICWKRNADYVAGLGHTLSNTAKDKDSPELLSLGKWQGPQERADECSGLRKDQETLLGWGGRWSLEEASWRRGGAGFRND